MTTPTDEYTIENLPPSAKVIEYVIELTPYPTAERETRYMDPRKLGPADDRLAAACNSGNPIGAMAAIERSGTLGLMVLWLVAGRQMGMKKEPIRVVENWFTIGALEDVDLETRLKVEIDEDDPSEQAEVDEDVDPS